MLKVKIFINEIENLLELKLKVKIFSVKLKVLKILMVEIENFF